MSTSITPAVSNTLEAAVPENRTLLLSVVLAETQLVILAIYDHYLAY